MCLFCNSKGWKSLNVHPMHCTVAAGAFEDEVGFKFPPLRVQLSFSTSNMKAHTCTLLLPSATHLLRGGEGPLCHLSQFSPAVLRHTRYPPVVANNGLGYKWNPWLHSSTLIDKPRRPSASRTLMSPPGIDFHLFTRRKQSMWVAGS